MRRQILVSALVTTMVLGAVGSSSARITGKGKRTADCDVVFDGITATKGVNIVECHDGDPSCDADSTAGQCTFSFQVCAFATDVPGCTPKPVKKYKPASLAGINLPPANASFFTCADTSSVVVTMKPKKSSFKKKTKNIRLVGVAKPADANKLVLRCLPGAGGTTTTTLPTTTASPCLPLSCPSNPTGPDQMDFKVVSNVGSDLDTGWTGNSHNFPIPIYSSLDICLSECDADGLCTASGKTGAGTLNGTLFGPPLPLLSADTPVCVVNVLKPGDITGKANYKTGEVPSDTPLNVNLDSKVFFTSKQNVCARCGSPSATVGTTATCDSTSATPGAQCTVESVITVTGALGDRRYPLSKSCVPGSGLSGVLDIPLRLTTGSSSMAGATPCTGPGLPPQSNFCTSGCGTANCTGAACVSRAPDGQCVDAKGGISQNCCNNNTAIPCFPSDAASGGVITRQGLATVPQPTSSQPFPTEGSGALATTFCIAQTGSSVINGVAGLPGPGALILAGDYCIQKQ